MKLRRFLLFIFISGIVIFSGCLREYGDVRITSVDVMYVQQENGTRLTITPYIQNDKDTDTGILTARVKIKEQNTNLIVAEKDFDIGYIKSKSSGSNSASLTIPSPGEYTVEVQLLEGSKLITQYFTPVTVKSRPGPGQPADVKLTDMKLVITKLYNDASVAIVEVSPGIYNQGGDSGPLTLEVIARVDQYTAYTERDDIGIVKGGSSVRGGVTFDIPRNREYSLSVNVIENGRTAASASVDQKIKLNEIKFNTPVNFVLVEEGKPRPAATKAPEGGRREPGFEGLIALFAVLLIYSITILRRNKKVK